MNRRFRVLAAFVALLAFAASFAEGVWASSSCAAMGQMDGSMDAAEIASMGDQPDSEMGAMSTTGGGAPAVASAPGASATPTPDCPLLGGCVTLSVPSVEPSVEFSPPGPAMFLSAVEVSPDLLLARSLLRPPRA